MKIKIATVAALALASASWTARAEKTALLTLQALSADVAPVSPPAAGSAVSSEACAWDSYKGTCFSISGKGEIYWIIREWDRTGPIGRTIIGYPEIRAKQRDYNKWTQDVLDPHAEYSGVTRLVGGEASGWQPDGFELADSIPDTGEVNRSTLRIPYFKAGARIVRLWHRFQADCAESAEGDSSPAYEAASCGKSIAELDPDAAHDEGTSLNRLLKLRAKWLTAAYQDTLRFDDAMKSVAVVLCRPEQLPRGFAEGLQAIAADIASDLSAAEDAETTYRRQPTHHDPFGGELQ